MRNTVFTRLVTDNGYKWLYRKESSMNLSINTNNSAMETMERTSVGKAQDNMERAYAGKAKENTERTSAQKADESARQQAEEAREYTAVSVQGDTVEISLEGKAAGGTSGDDAAAAESGDGKVTRIITETDTTQASASQTYQLSSYTENELRQMYQNGEITKAEYDEELESRE